MIDLIGKLVQFSLLAVGLATRTRYLNAMALQNSSFWLWQHRKTKEMHINTKKDQCLPLGEELFPPTPESGD